MPTNLAIDDALLREAQKLGGHRTKKETVEAALDEYVRLKRRLNFVSHFGEFEWDADYDSKAERLRNVELPEGGHARR